MVFSKLSWPSGGGGELATYLIIRDVLCRHFNVILVSGTDRPHSDLLRCSKYFYWSQLKTKFKPFEWLKLFAGVSVFRNLIENADTVYIPSQSLYPLGFIAKHLNSKTKVVTHLHNFQPISYTSVFLTNEAKMPLTDIARSVRLELLEHLSSFKALSSGLMSVFNFVNICSLMAADRIITVSHKQAEILAKRIPALAQKISVAYNPLPYFPPLEKKFEQPTLIYSGGTSYIKGFYVFMQAALAIVKKTNCVDFLLTKGSRGFKPEYEDLMCKYNNAHGMRFNLLGYLPYENLLKLYSRSRAVLVPSIWEEPLPYVVIEAMSMGSVPIASRVGGIPEIVRGTYADKTLFDPGDVQGLADKTERILCLSREELEDIGTDLRYTVMKRFSVENIHGKFAEIFGC